jgi:hypothetical protein
MLQQCIRNQIIWNFIHQQRWQSTLLTRMILYQFTPLFLLHFTPQHSNLTLQLTNPIQFLPIQYILHFDFLN